MNKRQNKNRPRAIAVRLPIWKKVVFSGVMLVTFLGLLELLLAVCGVEPILYEKDPYVGFSSHVRLFETDPSDAARMRTAKNKLTFFGDQHFEKEKPQDTYRIFCLGGSTTYGRPYGDGTSFCGWLRKLLPELDSSRKWELINAGGISYASYRVALLTEEISRYEPDLLIIYCGHNEFLEERTYRDVIRTPQAVRGLGALASHTRLFAAMSQLKNAITPMPNAGLSRPTTLPDKVVTRLDGDVIGPADYHRDRPLMRKILSHYRFNLSRMVDIAASAGARVIFVTPASNLRDCSPFKSEHTKGLSAANRRRVMALLDEGRSHLGDKQYQKARLVLQQALKRDPHYALLHFLHGQALLGLGLDSLARTAFERARDEDICPLRAVGAINQIVAEVAASRGAGLVDFDAVVRSRSPHSIPGENLFLDHVHPTILGNRLLALRIIDRMKQDKIIPPGSSLNSRAIDRVTRRVEGSISAQARTAALRNLSKVLQWAGKLEEAKRLGLRAGEQGDAEALFQAGVAAQKQGRLNEAITHYRGSLQLADVAVTHNALGGVLEMTNQFPEALAHYRRAIELAQGPQLAQAHTLAAGVLMRDDRFIDQAIEHLQAAIKIDPTYPHAHDRLGVILYRRGQNEPALQHFREAARLAPRDVAIQTRLVILLIDLGKLDEADSQLRRAIGRRPAADRWPEILDILASAYATAGRFPEAVKTAQQAIKRATAAGRDKLAAQIRTRLKLYKQNKPAPRS